MRRVPDTSERGLSAVELGFFIYSDVTDSFQVFKTGLKFERDEEFIRMRFDLQQ
jgi:hypothetical protein